MSDEQARLRKWFEREQARPRQTVIEALDHLQLQNGDRIADIGCGPGVHIKHMLERVGPEGRVVGIDTSQERLAVAREMLRDDVERGTIRLVEGDLHALDASLGPFDVVWMSMVLHHEDVPVDVVSGLREMVAPGGRIAVFDGDDLASLPFLPWSPELEMAVRRAVVSAAEDGDDNRWFGRRFTARNLPAIFADAGLVDIEVQAFVEMRQAPLDDWDRKDIQHWFLNSLGRRLRDHLTPNEWDRYEASFTTGTQDYLLDRPGFFFSRTWYLGVGTSP